MISIIIPLYNRVDLISFSLQSIALSKSTTSELEVIVVDDGSTDGGPDLVAFNFPWVKLIRNSVNKGAPSCRNQGLGIARGDFVLFLDSDDLIENDFFNTKLEAFAQFPNVVGVYGPWDHFESEDEFKEEHIRPRHQAYPLYDSSQGHQIMVNLLSGWFIHPGATLWRISAVRNIGGFNANLIVNQDVDFCFRMLLDYNIIGVDSPRALIRVHKGERVGTLPQNDGLPQKLNQILHLRRDMVARLSELDRYDENGRKAVAKYCFDFWCRYRKSEPIVAEKFLLFSKNQYPNLELKGTFGLRALSFILGAELAIKIKQWIGR